MKKEKRKYPYKTFIVFILLFGFLFNSCLGLNTDIQIRKDGSGKITVEYRFSRMIEAIGRMDGNEKWPIIPTGRADLERTAARIEGLRLVSFSTRQIRSPQGSGNNDIVNRATLEFKNLEALLSFLNPASAKEQTSLTDSTASPVLQAAHKNRVSLSRENNSNKLHITINEGISAFVDTDLLKLMQSLSSGYSFTITFSAGGNSSMIVTNGAGEEIAPPVGVEISKGKKKTLSVGTKELLDLQDGLGVIFIW